MIEIEEEKIKMDIFIDYYLTPGEHTGKYAECEIEIWYDKLKKYIKDVGIEEVDFYIYHNMDYKSYLKTEMWNIIAEWHKYKSGYKCRKCGRPEKGNGLNVHLTDYHYLYRDTHIYGQEYLIVLCTNCHKAVHYGKK